jgi:hypothetical protein
MNGNREKRTYIQLESGNVKIREVWPQAKGCWISPNSDKLRVRRHWAIEDEQLMPSGRRNECVWRRGYGAGIIGASESREYCPGAHGISVGGRRSCT